MELKKVVNQEKKDYAKKGEVSKKELKSFVPNKWVVASAAGLTVLFYSSPRFSINSIGVVIGCISVIQPGTVIVNLTPIHKILDTINAFSTILAAVSGFVFVIYIFSYGFVKVFKKDKNLDEATKKQNVKTLKVLGVVFIILLIAAFGTAMILETDNPIFYEGGVPRYNEGNMYK